MKRLLFTAIIILFSVYSANAQVVVKVKPITPGAAVVKPASPGPRYVWVDGHWRWGKHVKQYVWVAGHWVKAKKGRVWKPGHWVEAPGGWKWIPGHWGR